jgi:polyphosphate kinase
MPDTREQLNEILDALRNDREKSWLMLPDGTYIREEGGAGTSSQEALYRYFSNRKVSLTEEIPEEPEAPALPEEPEPVREEAPRQQENPKRSWFRRMFG